MNRYPHIIFVCVILLTVLNGQFLRVAIAHRSGCHRWHTCPSDSGSYTCGDLGYPCSSGGGSYTSPTTPYTAPTTPYTAPTTPYTAPTTVYDTSLLFVDYWQTNGGLNIFGYGKNSGGINKSGYYSQIFERFRLEYHSENQKPYDVQLGLLGEERLLQLGRVWQNEPTFVAQPDCIYSTETKHNVCGIFKKYWRTHGVEFDGKRGFSVSENIALFGLPITEATMEVGSDGQIRLTQWFQRARFEDHGAEGVLLGLLGNEVYNK